MTESAGSAGQRKSRSEGQWAVGGDRQPLNDNERIKQEDDGLNVRHRIEEVYSKKRGGKALYRADACPRTAR